SARWSARPSPSRSPRASPCCSTSTSASVARPSTWNSPARRDCRTTGAPPAPPRGADGVSAPGGGRMAAAWRTRGDGAGPPVTIPRDAAREAAERELSKPAYHENDPSWFMRALNKFWEWVDKLFSAASGAAPGGTVGLLVIVLAVVAVAAALWWRLG